MTPDFFSPPPHASVGSWRGYRNPGILRNISKAVRWVGRGGGALFLLWLSGQSPRLLGREVTGEKQTTLLMGTKTRIALLNWGAMWRQGVPSRIEWTLAEGNGWPLGREQSLVGLRQCLLPPAFHLPARLTSAAEKSLHHKIPALKLWLGRSGKRETSALLSPSKTRNQ